MPKKPTKKALNTKEFVSLQEAIQMDNSTPAPQAWVFNKHLLFATIPPDVKQGSQEQVIAVTAKADPSVHMQCWEIQAVSNFANREQIQYLIERKEFYYAIEKRFAGQ